VIWALVGELPGHPVSMNLTLNEFQGFFVNLTRCTSFYNTLQAIIIIIIIIIIIMQLLARTVGKSLQRCIHGCGTFDNCLENNVYKPKRKTKSSCGHK